MLNKKHFLAFVVSSVFFLSGCQSSKQYVLRDPHPESDQKKLAVSTSEPLAAEAAKEVFEAGGNIADAAVAASFAISVVRPQSTGIGGGGFLLYYPSKGAEAEPAAWDFRETAPHRAHRNMFLKYNKKTKQWDTIEKLSSLGSKAVATPGLVAGMYEFHRKHGHLSWREVLQPAIRLAGSEVTVSSHMSRALRDMKDEILKDPEMAKIFAPSGEVLQEGEVFIQSDLQNTLREIAETGKKYFYNGEFSKRLAEWSKAHSGVIRSNDLRMYQVKVRRPLREKWRNFEILSMPPPSSGGIHLIQILKMVDFANEERGVAPRLKGSEDVGRITEIEAMKRAFADRAVWLGDPDYVKVPSTKLLSDEYLKIRALEFASSEIKAAKDILPFDEKSLKDELHPKQTTHLSLIDSDGNSISTTQTVNSYFGAVVMVPGTGVILNNEMDDFSVKPGVPNGFGLVGGKFNEIAPGKRPLSSMTPTIVVDKNGQAIMAIGAPGGSRIITGTYYVLSRILRERESVESALSGCRFHHQWSPDKVTLEPACFAADAESLKNFYPVVEEAKPFFFGEVQVAARINDLASEKTDVEADAFNGPVLFSGVDPRGNGRPYVFSRPRK